MHRFVALVFGGLDTVGLICSVCCGWVLLCRFCLRLSVDRWGVVRAAAGCFAWRCCFSLLWVVYEL